MDRKSDAATALLRKGGKEKFDQDDKDYKEFDEKFPNELDDLIRSKGYLTDLGVRFPSQAEINASDAAERIRLLVASQKAEDEADEKKKQN